MKRRSKVRFGEPPLQRTPATRHGEQASGKLSDGQAFKPSRRGDCSPDPTPDRRAPSVRIRPALIVLM